MERMKTRGKRISQEVIDFMRKKRRQPRSSTTEKNGKKEKGDQKQTETKRRISVTDQFKCDTFLISNPIVENLTTKIQSDDEVDSKRLKMIEKYIDQVEIIGFMEENETGNSLLNDDEFKKQLLQDRARNQMERISQMKNLDVSVYAEKLASYDSYATLYGPNRSLIRSYHPDMLKFGDAHEVPSVVVWNRPFSYLMRVNSQLNIDEKVTNFINNAVESKRNERKKNHLAKILQEWRAAKNKLSVETPEQTDLQGNHIKSTGRKFGEKMSKPAFRSHLLQLKDRLRS